MKKSDLIAMLAERKNLTEEIAADAVNLIFKEFTDALKNGGRIELRGFGSFTVKDFKAYIGRNPKSGKKIQVKPKKSAVFKVGKQLKERVDN